MNERHDLTAVLSQAEADLQCANAMLEDAIQGYHLSGDALQLVIERDELRELVGRLADKMSEGQWEQDKVTGEDVCSWCGDVRDITTGSDTCHCSWGQDINDARKLGLGG